MIRDKDTKRTKRQRKRTTVMEEMNGRKRPREEEGGSKKDKDKDKDKEENGNGIDENDENDEHITQVAKKATTTTESKEGVSTASTIKTPPEYGSQSYWEDRYRQIKQMRQDEEEPDPFHAWYFNYEDLAPLILPLILGDGNADEEQNEDEDDKVDEDDTKSNETKSDIPSRKKSDNHITSDGKKTTDELGKGQSDKTWSKHGEQQNISEKSKGGVASHVNDDKNENDKNGDNREAENDENNGEEEEDAIQEEEEENDDNFFDEDEDDEEEELPSKRIGLAKDGPVSVLEVGCGDVPLGRDLAKGIEEFQAMTGVDATNILQKVVCVDYSENVIEAMKLEQKMQQNKTDARNNSNSNNNSNRNSNNTEIDSNDENKSDINMKNDENDNDGKDDNDDDENINKNNKASDKNNECCQVPLIYEVVDARKLPYNNESYEIILEKGTLDAMLSDTDVGKDNCRQIVGECARVLTIGGFFVIISHVNAHVQSGLDWLNDIVIPGLRTGAGDCEWLVEVHGNEADVPTDDENNYNETVSSPSNPLDDENPGPAVYIINKGARRPSDVVEDQPTIPLRFFSY